MRFKKTVMTGVVALSVVGAGAGSAFAAAPAAQTGGNINCAAVPSFTIQGYDYSLDDLLQRLQSVNPYIDWSGFKYSVPGSAQTPAAEVPDTGAAPGTSTPAPPAAQAPDTETAAPDAGTSAPATGAGSSPAAKPDTGTDTASSSAYAEQVVALVNTERAKAGLSPLASNAPLTVMALDKAKDMYTNQYFDHTSPTYGSPFDMMKAYGISYTYAGENIAKGQRTPEEVMNAWMNSQGHRQNILSPNFTQIGVAYYNGEWVQEFIAN
ncbi:uncharacterized protein, YkwD family [Paenibacillus sp. UNCCL117]|uniref:CAP domain-containing protein n=1 Tax=unclassified Paenibacillus TaxID=185978 RepID=UPI000886996E|nr:MULTISPECIES: CAP domain-containing protein [unclassified Paenibacillus]SDC25490.1 uncharacterized protein, YkwD family [Paenibacillus sp. cl123]SFW19838.1 uncharacterized protein, YkwD family [Paenibacillus sp. UNCCL117]